MYRVQGDVFRMDAADDTGLEVLLFDWVDVPIVMRMPRVRPRQLVEVIESPIFHEFNIPADSLNTTKCGGRSNSLGRTDPLEISLGERSSALTSCALLQRHAQTANKSDVP